MLNTLAYRTSEPDPPKGITRRYDVEDHSGDLFTCCSVHASDSALTFIL